MKKYEGESFSFVVVFNDVALLRNNLLSSAVARVPDHEWILIDNERNARGQNMSTLYQEALQEVSNDLVFFVHQDVWLPPRWERDVRSQLCSIEAKDHNWGVVGGAGVVPMVDLGRALRGHYRDPWGYQNSGPLPAEVESLDEFWLGLRASRGLRFDPGLPGFHCYGTDICLTAREHGARSYAIDAFAWHRRFDPGGAHILDPSDSIRRLAEDSFRSDFTRSVVWMAAKWRKFLPFRSTTCEWGENVAWTPTFPWPDEHEYEHT